MRCAHLRLHCAPCVINGRVGRLERNALGKGSTSLVDGALRLEMHAARLPKSPVATLTLGCHREQTRSICRGPASSLRERDQMGCESLAVTRQSIGLEEKAGKSRDSGVINLHASPGLKDIVVLRLDSESLLKKRRR